MFQGCLQLPGTQHVFGHLGIPFFYDLNPVVGGNRWPKRQVFDLPGVSKCSWLGWLRWMGDEKKHDLLNWTGTLRIFVSLTALKTNMTLENPYFQQEIHLQMMDFPFVMLLVFVGVHPGKLNILNPKMELWKIFFSFQLGWICLGSSLEIFRRERQKVAKL